MELIVGHEATDFDAFAASVAASLLYPGAVIGLAHALAPVVRDFRALHKDRFVTERVERLDLSQVSRLIIVDVRNRRRLKHVARVLERVDAGEPVEVHIYDHHPATSDDLTGLVHVVEPVGAVTTLLVERLRARQVPIDPVEATLFALGIYTDTAALTLGNTTPRDAHAAAWLLERGASLAVINRYLTQPFNDAQRAVLAEALANVRVEQVGGVPVGVSIVHTEGHVHGLAEVTSAACKLLEDDAFFLICSVADKKVEVVGRARTGLIDIGAAMRTLGGGGHQGAGSAIVKKGDPDALASRLLDALRVAPARQRTVGDVMSSPVRCVPPDLAIEELGRLLEAWGHSGAPVARDGELLGVISQRDVARACDAGRGRLPVSSHMSGHALTTEPERSLEDALAIMVADDVGRLPVLREGKIVGILSRTDALRVLYGANASDR